MDNDAIILRSVKNASKCLKLNDGAVFLLGRNRESQITDTRCSRTQCKVIFIILIIDSLNLK